MGPWKQPTFEWDPDKERENIRKHGIGFDLAQTVFEDVDVLIHFDRHIDNEDRWHALGLAGGEILILVVHTVRYASDDQEIIRIISARKAERWECREYRAVNS